MSTQKPHVIVLSQHDESGIQGIWGPYSDAEHANEVLAVLKTWPAMADAGRFAVVELLDFDPTPRPVKPTFRGGGMMDPDF